MQVLLTCRGLADAQGSHLVRCARVRCISRLHVLSGAPRPRKGRASIILTCKPFYVGIVIVWQARNSDFRSTFSTLTVSPASCPKRCLKQRYYCKPVGHRRILDGLCQATSIGCAILSTIHTLLHADLHRLPLCIPAPRNLESPAASAHTRGVGDS